jgi:uncharacterized protein YkwD
MRVAQSRESPNLRLSDYRSEDVMKHISFFRNSVTFLFIAIFSLNVIGQDNSNASKTAFGTLGNSTEKPEATVLTRPRLAYVSKAIQAYKEEELPTPNQNATFKANAVLVDSAALASKLEQQAFEILNEKRKENGLPPVQWSEDMAKVARLHSENMAKFKFFSHSGQDGLMVNDRADQLGFSKWKAIGENIAYNRGYDNPAEFACERWMQSPSHRENILNKRWKEAGLGVSITPEGTYYFTQVFVIR